MTEARHAGPMSAQAAAAVSKRTPLSAGAKIMKATPGFIFVLIVYTIITLFVPDVRVTAISLGNYDFAWIEAILLIATMTAIFELLRVSKPGIDNTIEAIGMGAVFVLYLMLFILAAAGVMGQQLYGTTEFATLTFVSMSQMVVAFLINARTLKRTIDYSGGE
jgi:hypothetical protein